MRAHQYHNRWIITCVFPWYAWSAKYHLWAAGLPYREQAEEMWTWWERDRVRRVSMVSETCFVFIPYQGKDALWTILASRCRGVCRKWAWFSPNLEVTSTELSASQAHKLISLSSVSTELKPAFRRRRYIFRAEVVKIHAELTFCEQCGVFVRLRQ